MLLPPLMLTDLDKIFIGGTSHHGLPPCKISSKSEHFKCPKFCSKIKNWKKMTPKIVFELVALSYQGRHVWTMGQSSFKRLLVMPKKNFMTLGAFFGCQITVLWRPLDQKSRKLPIFGLFSICNLKKKLKYGPEILPAHVIDPIMFYVKNMECQKKF